MNRFVFLFYFLSSLFILSIIRLSITIPIMFNETNGYKFDYLNKFNNPDQRQVALLISDVGLININLIPIGLYILMGVYLNVLGNQKYKKLFFGILGFSLTALGLIVSIISVWRA